MINWSVVSFFVDCLPPWSTFDDISVREADELVQQQKEDLQNDTQN